MSENACPKCLKTLPASTVRAQAWGTTCPFCAAFLKRPAKPAAPADDGYASFEVSKSPAPAPIKPVAAAAPKADDGYASFEVSAAPPPAKPALATSAKALRSTMVGTAVAPRDLPFEGTPAPIAFSLSPPATTPSTRAPAAPARAAAPVRASVAPSLAPRPAAPGLTPPAPASQPRGSGTVMPFIRPADSEPTGTSGAARGQGFVRALATASSSEPVQIAPSSTSAAADPGPLVTDSDEGPTNAMPPRTPEPAVEAPLLFPDSEPIASVSMLADPEARATPLPFAAAAPPPVLLEPARPWARNALVFGATALATIVIVLGVKVIGGPKPRAPAESAKGSAAAQPAVPDIDPLPAARPAEPPVVTPAADPEPAARPAPPPAVAMKVAPAREAPARRAEVSKTAPAKPAPVAHKRGAGNHKVKVARGGKVARGKGARARKLAMRQPAAKQSAPTPPAERADPRAPYERGNALLFANDGRGAIAAYREAVRSAPSDPIGFRGLGLAYEHEGETALAIKALRHYLKLAPDAPDRAIIARRIDRLSKRAKKK